jgi:two-component system OmpR family response regulator
VSGATILLVEDDTQLCEQLVRGLTEEGFDARSVTTGAASLASVAERPPDVLIVDVGLPDTDGRDLVQALRARGVNAPVLFLTARDALVDRLAGFDAGGDDYVTKPFAFAEVVSRLNALLRRAGVNGEVEGAGLRLDPVTHEVAAGERTVALTPTEFRLLARLLARPGEAVRRRDLVRAGWAYGSIVSDNALDVYVARLRRKLRTVGDAPGIRTVHGVGYRIE